MTNMVWVIIYLTAMVSGVLACIMFPARWLLARDINMDELPFILIIAVLITAINILAKNGGTIEPFEDHSIMH